jgi:hypothetical protein
MPASTAQIKSGFSVFTSFVLRDDSSERLAGGSQDRPARRTRLAAILTGSMDWIAAAPAESAAALRGGMIRQLANRRQSKNGSAFAAWRTSRRAGLGRGFGSRTSRASTLAAACVLSSPPPSARVDRPR